MTCHGNCGHGECDGIQVRGTVVDATPSDALRVESVSGNPAADFWGDVFRGRDPMAEARRRDAAAAEAARRAGRPKPKPTTRPAAARPAPRPAPRPQAARPSASHPLPPGMTRCDAWRSDRGRPSVPKGGKVQTAPGGWWRVCYGGLGVDGKALALAGKPLAPPGVLPLDPTEAADLNGLCAVLGPVDAAQSDEEVAWSWLECGQTPDDLGVFLDTLVALGRDVEASMFAEAIDNATAVSGWEVGGPLRVADDGATLTVEHDHVGAWEVGGWEVGAIPTEVRVVDDVLSSVWDAVKTVVPGGGAIDAVHRARRDLMYGPTATARPKTAPRAATRAESMVREAQRLVRAARKGDAAADTTLARYKAEAEANPEARRRWAVMVATMRDHDARVDARTEGRTPALVSVSATGPARLPASTAATRPAARGGGGGLGGLGALFGGGR